MATPARQEPEEHAPFLPPRTPTKIRHLVSTNPRSIYELYRQVITEDDVVEVVCCPSQQDVIDSDDPEIQNTFGTSIILEVMLDPRVNELDMYMEKLDVDQAALYRDLNVENFAGRYRDLNNENATRYRDLHMDNFAARYRDLNMENAARFRDLHMENLAVSYRDLNMENAARYRDLKVENFAARYRDLNMEYAARYRDLHMDNFAARHRDLNMENPARFRDLNMENIAVSHRDINMENAARFRDLHIENLAARYRDLNMENAARLRDVRMEYLAACFRDLHMENPAASYRDLNMENGARFLYTFILAARCRDLNMENAARSMGNFASPFMGNFSGHYMENSAALSMGNFSTHYMEDFADRCWYADLENLAALFSEIRMFSKEPTDIMLHQLAVPAGDVDEDDGRLLLDSGAAINAVSKLFKNLRDIQHFAAPMWVTLPDGSRLRILGVGTIHSDNDFSIPNVYVVEGLKKNLISVSQLDKEHGLCCSFHTGQCEVMAKDGVVVGGALLQDDGLYVLRFLQVPGPALVQEKTIVDAA